MRDTPVSFEEQPPSEVEIARRTAAVSEGYPWLVAEVAPRNEWPEVRANLVRRLATLAPGG